ncbi:hypothetical protein D3C74_470120 [compost metagenome]
MFMYADDLVAVPVRVELAGVHRVAMAESGAVHQTAVVVNRQCAVHDFIFTIGVGIKHT